MFTCIDVRNSYACTCTAAHAQSWLSGNRVSGKRLKEIIIQHHCEVGRRIKHLQGGTQAHIRKLVYTLCWHMSTHRPMHSTAYPPHSHRAIPTQASALSILRNRPRWRGWKRQRMGSGGGAGWGSEGYPCMQSHRFTHPGWAWEQAILTLTHIVLHRPTLPSLETPQAL